MLRFLAVTLAMTTVSIGAYSGTPTNRDDDSQLPSISLIHRAPRMQSHSVTDMGFNTSSAGRTNAACCKICTTGKACGNTCISRNDICHVGPGCACDG
jgi:hypothetical protein